MRRITMLKDYRGAFLNILSAPTEERGATYDEIAATVPVMVAIRQLPDTATHLHLEESEWQVLARRVKTARFQLIHEDVLKMCRAILDAQQVDINEVKAG